MNAIRNVYIHMYVCTYVCIRECISQSVCFGLKNINDWRGYYMEMSFTLRYVTLCSFVRSFAYTAKPGTTNEIKNFVSYIFFVSIVLKKDKEMKFWHFINFYFEFIFVFSIEIRKILRKILFSRFEFISWDTL